MLQAMNLSTRARTAIKNWFEWHDVTEITLREFMDLVISDKPHRKPGFLITPLLDVRNVKLHTFWSTVKRLTEADLGRECNLEWKRRLTRLNQASRIVGGVPLTRRVGDSCPARAGGMAGRRKHGCHTAGHFERHCSCKSLDINA